MIHKKSRKISANSNLVDDHVTILYTILNNKEIADALIKDPQIHKLHKIYYSIFWTDIELQTPDLIKYAKKIPDNDTDHANIMWVVMCNKEFALELYKYLGNSIDEIIYKALIEMIHICPPNIALHIAS